MNPGTFVIIKDNVAGMIISAHRSYHRYGITYRVMVCATDAFFRIAGGPLDPLDRRREASRPENFLEDFRNLIFTEHPVIIEADDIHVREFVTDVDLERYDPCNPTQGEKNTGSFIEKLFKCRNRVSKRIPG